MHRHIVPSRESRSLTPPPEALLFEKLFQILLRGGDGSNAEIFYKVVQHIGRNERRQRGAKANILDPQIQQRQQNAHAFCSYHERTMDNGKSFTPQPNASANASAILTAP